MARVVRRVPPREITVTRAPASPRQMPELERKSERQIRCEGIRPHTVSSHDRNREAEAQILRAGAIIRQFQRDALKQMND